MGNTVAVVLAAGSGTRLRPLTDIRPKALCPVGNVALVDHAISRVSAVSEAIAVNTWHHQDQMVEHLEGRVELSVEDDPLGTAGALGKLRPWIDGRDLVIHNADAWHVADLSRFVEGWDHERVRLLVSKAAGRPDFDDWRFCGVSLMPWRFAAELKAVRSGLWEVCWSEQWRRGAIDVVPYEDAYFDCGTPSSYLAANLMANDGESVVGPGAVVDGAIERCVIWPNGKVHAGEHLVDCIRVGDDLTVDATRAA